MKNKWKLLTSMFLLCTVSLYGQTISDFSPGCLTYSTVNPTVNLALGKQTYDSKTAGGSSAWAVDGYTDGNYQNHVRLNGTDDISEFNHF